MSSASGSTSRQCGQQRADALSDFDAVHTYLGVPSRPAWMVDGTIVARLSRHAQTQGNAPFLTAVSADGTSKTLTYRQVEDLSRRMAGWLHRTVVVSPAAVVGFVPCNDAASVVAILGLLRAGCPVLLLSPADPPGRGREQLDALGARLLLRSPALPPVPELNSLAVPDIDELPEQLATVADVAPDPLADALYFGTSGSTASSKLVAQSHYNTIVNAAAVVRHHRLHSSDRIVGCLPIHHVNGLHFTVFGTIAAGAHLILAHAFDPFGYPQLLERYRPRLASVVPSLLEGLLQMYRGAALPVSLEYFVSAAAPLQPSTAREVWRRLGVRVIQGYGLTETTNFSTTIPVDISSESYQRLVLHAEIPSIGVAVYGNEVAVLRPDGTRAEPGEAGEICMRGHNVMNRYAGNTGATLAAFSGGWFHSQDLGYSVRDNNHDGEFFVITGRSKNIAKVGGETVSLEEMERVMRSVPGVRDAACACVPHRFTGEQIVAAVVCDGDRVGDMRERLGQSFARFVLPRRFVVLDAIPRTATGKILRPQLTEMLAAADGTGHS